MKNILTIAAIAVLTVFAAVSCTPEVSVSSYDYDYINKKPENPSFAYTSAAPIFDGSGFDSADKPRITMTIPAIADIHRNFSLSALQSFLSFHQFSNPTEANWQEKGLVSELGPSIVYTLVSRVGENITLELSNKFEGEYSRIIAKINTSVYTYSNGLKLDIDYNGIGGEAGYDNLTFNIDIPGAQSRPWVPVDGRRNWNVNLSVSPVIYYTNALNPLWSSSNASESNTMNIYFNAINIYGLSSIDTFGEPAYKEVGEMVAGNVELQKFSADKWVKVANAEYDPNFTTDLVFDPISYIIFKGVSFERDTRYRIAWIGDSDLKTNGIYFGLKQRVYVAGNTPSGTSIGTTFLPSGGAAFQNRYKQKMVFTDEQMQRNTYSPAVNGDPRPYPEQVSRSNGPISSVSQENKSPLNGNVVLKVTFQIFGDYQLTPSVGYGLYNGPLVGLAEIGLEAFKECFKIVYRRNGAAISNIGDYAANNDVVEVGIQSIRFAKEGKHQDNSGVAVDNNTYFNVIYITLDPDYKQVNNLGILINDGLKYTGTTPPRVFGDRDNNYLFNNFEVYY